MATTDSPLLIALGRELRRLREPIMGIGPMAERLAPLRIASTDQGGLSRLETGQMGWPGEIDLIVDAYARECKIAPFTIWKNALREAGYIRSGRDAGQRIVSRAAQAALDGH